MNINFTGKDRYHQEQTTIHWFDVDGVGYGISDCNGEKRLVDSENMPIIEEGENIKIANVLRIAILDEITITVKKHIVSMYENTDMFLCGDEIYIRDELDCGAIAEEIDDNNYIMENYVSDMLIVK